MAQGVQVETVPLDAGRVDLAAMLRRLGELEINEVWVEAGPTLNGALLTAGLVDELLVYLAASVLGTSARGMFDIPPLTDLAARPEFRLQSVRHLGDDLRLIYTPRAPSGSPH
jgi:diaminohydroxyphosphoribosylaminopyrimidine deaminase/5-amino-6-(5-phosphoribosylamino)uracil reductase